MKTLKKVLLILLAGSYIFILWCSSNVGKKIDKKNNFNLSNGNISSDRKVDSLNWIIPKKIEEKILCNNSNKDYNLKNSCVKREVFLLSGWIRSWKLLNSYI